MANITINDLTEITEITDSHFLAVDDGTASTKISVENFNATATASAAAYAQDAADSASAASDSEDAAKGYKETVEQAINDASTIVANAQTYANSAEGFKNDASGFASDASTYASQAAGSATLAASYATGVQAYVTEAKSYAEGGTGSRVGEDQDNAKFYSQAAHTSETNAAASESNAATSEANAASSEANAAASESNASGYATDAETSALKAEGYAVGTQNGTPATSGQPYYHDNAKYYKEEAADSATNAASSEYNAGLSESAASGYATAADGSAEDSEAWAVGKRDGVDVPATDPAYHNNAKYWADVAAGGVSGVSSFNGRSGNVVPASGDYAANIIEYVNTSSGLAATDVQDAIDELDSDLGTLDSSLATVAKTGAYSDLSGNPTLGTAAAKDVPVSGNASTTQVVMGDDSRLTDSRTPTSHTHTKSDITDFPSLGTAAAKDSTNAVTQSSTDLVESGAVYTALGDKADSSKAYQTDDTSETSLASDDVIPFYDTSATAKRKMTVQKFGEQLISNPNLFDNPWFTVNQRGQNSYSTQYKYTVDRWRNDGDSLQVIKNNDGSISLSYTQSANQNVFLQFIDETVYEYLYNKTLTMSVMFSDGNIYSKTFQFPSSLTVNTTIATANLDVSSHKMSLYCNSSGDLYFLILFERNAATVTMNIKAVKLEVGSVSTLALDTAPNYQQELAKCQRYFVRLGDQANYYSIGTFIKLSNASVYGFVPLPTTMRTTPTVTIGGNTSQHVFYLTGFSNGAYSQIAGVSNSYKTQNLCYLVLDGVDSSISANTGGMLFLSDQGYLDFSADL